MAEVLLQVEGLRVDYDDVTAVRDVSFSVEAGMIYGLIGPNGAGKTSILRVIANLLEPTWGRVRVVGMDLLEDPRACAAHVGFMPDFPPLYDELTVQEFLELFASAYGIPHELRARRIRSLVEKVDLVQKLEQPAGSLSRGMRQRLFLAKTLLHDPAVLLLDEPASGLDPLARIELCKLLIELGKEGKAVVVSSHILAEMADFCNAVGILEQGRMKVSGRINAILQGMEPERLIELRLVDESSDLKPFLEGWTGLSGLSLDGASAQFRLRGEKAEAAELLRALILHNFQVVAFHEKEGDLQDLFLRVSSGRVS